MSSQLPSGNAEPRDIFSWLHLSASTKSALPALLAIPEFHHIQQQWQRFSAACQEYGQQTGVTNTFTLWCLLPEPQHAPVLTVLLQRRDQEPTIVQREVSLDALPVELMREILLALGTALTNLGY